MKKRKSSKLLAILLAVAVAVTMTPFIAFANNEADTQQNAMELKTTEEGAEISYKIASSSKKTLTVEQIKKDKQLTVLEDVSGDASGNPVVGVTVENLIKGESIRENEALINIKQAGDSKKQKYTDYKYTEYCNKLLVAFGTKNGEEIIGNKYDASGNPAETMFKVYNISNGKMLADRVDQIAIKYDFGYKENTFTVKGDGVRTPKTVTLDELKAMAQKAGAIRTLKYSAKNDSSESVYEETGIYLEDLLALEGLGINWNVNDEFGYELTDDYGTMKLSDLLYTDKDGHKTMLAWKEKLISCDNPKDPSDIGKTEELEYLKLILGQKKAGEENQPNWKKYIGAFEFHGGTPRAYVGDKVKKGKTTYVVTAEMATVSLAKAQNKKSVTVPATVTINGVKYKVTGIAKKAFAKTKKVKTLTIKSKYLTKAGVKGSLKGSKISKIKVKVGSKKANKKYVKTYKKIFKKKNSGKSVKVFR